MLIIFLKMFLWLQSKAKLTIIPQQFIRIWHIPQGLAIHRLGIGVETDLFGFLVVCIFMNLAI